MHILVVCLNPTVQRTFVVENFRVGEVNRAGRHRTDASGKGVNVARVLAQLGARATHLTHSGGRDHPLFRELAEDDGVEIDSVETEIEVRTAYTIVDPAAGVSTELVEEGMEVPPDVEGRVRARVLRHLSVIDGLIITGSKAPGFSSSLYPWIVAEARRQGITVLTDYRGTDLEQSLASGPHFIKPNIAEFLQTFLPERVPPGGVSERGVDEVLAAAVKEEMIRIHREDGVVPIVTRGPRSTFYVEDGAVREDSPIEIEPVNTIGSGDAFAAGFMHRHLEGSPLLEAIRFGHECAAANARVLKPGSLRD